MGLLSIYFDTTNKKLVRGVSDDTVFQIPDQHQEDSPIIDLKVLKQVNWLFSPFYERIPLAGYALQISVGTAGSILASQNTFELSADGYMLNGELGLNTDGINALADGALVMFEVRLLSGTSYYRLTTEIRIRKSVALAASLSAPAEGTPLSKEEANALYHAKAGLRSFVMQTSDGSRSALVYLNDDMTLRAEEIV